ncbi:DUF5050 domain-containing protein [Bacillus sp. FSL K6-3431]|uniref:DUF5050 domain-containing protein n=1 Tax=Bacillus sp. FSL K6-3431 TaxID=2921500 RepID=UPI0030F77108
MEENEAKVMEWIDDHFVMNEIEIEDFPFFPFWKNGSYPLQSLSYFGTSAKNMTLFSTFLWVTAIKIFGNLCFAMLIMFVSVCTKKYALTLFTCTAIILLPYYGFSLASSKYILPGPLGFMVSTGFFKGSEYEYNIFTDQMDLVFQGVSTMALLILFAVTLCMSIVAFIVMMIWHTNVWSTRKQNRLLRTFSLMLFLVISVSSLAGCTSNENTGDYDIYYNSTRQSFENEHYRFYVDETDLSDIKLVFEDKETGEIRNFVRNPMQSLTAVETNIYGNGSLVYYMKLDHEKSKFNTSPDKFSVIEVDTTTFDERIIFEGNANTARDSFLGLNKALDADTLSFFGIEFFFLDEHRIYFVYDDEIMQVNKLTGKMSIIISLPPFKIVAFDGQSIYYVNEKYQVAKYDTTTESETVLPDIITTYFVLTDTELLFLNRQDQYKIYAMNLDDFTTRKITDKSVLSFTSDDQTIFYEGRDDLKKYRIDRDGENDTLISE